MVNNLVTVVMIVVFVVVVVIVVVVVEPLQPLQQVWLDRRAIQRRRRFTERTHQFLSDH